jgi:hypothetical protein
MKTINKISLAGIFVLFAGIAHADIFSIYPHDGECQISGWGDKTIDEFIKRNKEHFGNAFTVTQEPQNIGVSGKQMAFVALNREGVILFDGTAEQCATYLGKVLHALKMVDDKVNHGDKEQNIVQDISDKKFFPEGSTWTYEGHADSVRSYLGELSVSGNGNVMVFLTTIFDHVQTNDGVQFKATRSTYAIDCLKKKAGQMAWAAMDNNGAEVTKLLSYESFPLEAYGDKSVLAVAEKKFCK